MDTSPPFFGGCGNEGEGDATAHSKQSNGNPVQPDPPSSPLRPRRPRGTQGSLGPHEPMALVAPAPNPYVKCPIFSAKPDGNAGKSTQQ